MMDDRNRYDGEPDPKNPHESSPKRDADPSSSSPHGEHNTSDEQRNSRNGLTKKASGTRSYGDPLSCPICRELISQRRLVPTPGLAGVLELVHRIGESDITIEIAGPTGSGKELVALLIHLHSRRAKGPFVAVNVGAVAESLCEAKFMGHAKGAFTGALKDRPGVIEEANDGTLFADEIADASFTVQRVLLRALQERVICRIGETNERPVSFRLVVASHTELAECVESGSIRADFYYRVSGVQIRIPALSERREDIRLLARAFLERFCKEQSRQVTGFTNNAMKKLMRYGWPGNVRELMIVVQRAVTLAAPDGQIAADDIGFSPAGPVSGRAGRKKPPPTSSNRATPEPAGGGVHIDFEPLYQLWLRPDDEGRQRSILTIYETWIESNKAKARVLYKQFTRRFRQYRLWRKSQT